MSIYSKEPFQANKLVKVKGMQRSGTEAIRTQTQPSKPKREITNITNCQNTKRTYGQPRNMYLRGADYKSNGLRVHWCS